MNKTALITGVSGGIGSATAVLFAKAGYNVAIHFNKNVDEANRLANLLCRNNCSAAAMRADVADKGEVAEMFNNVSKCFGGVDVLVNNAGVALQKLFTDVSDDEADRIIDVNVKGTMNCCREALPYMIHNKCGSIVNVSSIWGVCGASCEVHYSAAKAAVIGFTKALAKEVGPSGIRVNCIAPGVIDTKMNSMHSVVVLTELAQQTPLGRIGTPQDVADAIFFLSSDAAAFITGQILCVDGGLIV